MENEKKEIVNAVGAATEKALDFIEKAVAGPLIEGTGIFTDKVKFWRFKNQVKIIIKAREFLKENGIDIPKKIPIKDITTLLEYASFEEDENMQDHWALLLANTLNPNNTFDACFIFSQVLNQLSINEITILNYLFSKCFIMSSEDRPFVEKNDILRKGFADYHLSEILLDNLLRLRVIEENPPKMLNEYSSNISLINEYQNNEILPSDSVRLSKFGSELLRMINL